MKVTRLVPTRPRDTDTVDARDCRLSLYVSTTDPWPEDPEASRAAPG